MFDIKNKEDCFIYGAGEQARIVKKILNEIYSIQIKAFIVSDITNNPMKVEEVPVIGVNQMDSLEKHTRIVIATSLQFVEEIEC